MKLPEKSLQIMEYLQQNGGRVSTTELSSSLGREPNSISGSVTSLTRKGLAIREKVAVEGEDKPVTYVVLTDDGVNFVQSEDEDE